MHSQPTERKRFSNEHRWNAQSDELIRNVEKLLAAKRRKQMHLVTKK